MSRVFVMELQQSPSCFSFSQLEPGLTVATYGRTVTETDLVNFLAFSGLRMPVFLNAQWAEQEGPFSARIAPGFMTASMSAGMLETVLGHNVLAGLSIDGLSFPKPVFIGDTLNARIAVVERRVSKRPDRGVVTVQVEMVNQRGEVTLQYRSTVLLRTD